MNWLKRQWQKFKGWFIALLVTIGLISAPLLMAAPKTFTWTNPTQRIDGTAYDAATEQAEVRIYCDGALLVASPLDGTSIVGNLGFGSHTCYATAVDNFAAESAPSNTVTFVLTPANPNPPVLSTL